MPSLKAIRNRVKSVKNTQKITRAMKLVAAARLRRATDAVTAARPYALKMRETIAQLVAEVESDAHPLFRVAAAPDKCLLIPMTSDRGLAGAFNSGILRRTDRFVRENPEGYGAIGVSAIGRKGRGYFARSKTPSFIDPADVQTARHARTASALARLLIERFISGELDEVYLVYNEFKSALTQTVVVEKLLPLDRDGFAEVMPTGDDATLERIFEPSREALLEVLLPRYVETVILRALLESEASEHGARMTAMDNATRNAGDLIDRLTLQMNRARQAIITTELMEITAGAESLKG
jgi:F-type H+-transporting ATPase subunit gamma